MSTNISRPSLAGDIVRGALQDPQIKQQLIGGIFGLLGGLLAKLLGQGKNTTKEDPVAPKPEAGQPLPNDDMDAPRIPPTPSVADKLKAYTGVKIGVKQAQYNGDLFPAEFEGGKQGMYKPARQGTYNRRSKIWFDASPLKGSHVVQFEEGRDDGVLWKPEFHFEYEGAETICYANENVRQDTKNGADRPIQVVEGDVTVGFSAWDYTYGFTPQINVGENEGRWRVWVVFLGFKSDVIEFEVS